MKSALIKQNSEEVARLTGQLVEAKDKAKKKQQELQSQLSDWQARSQQEAAETRFAYEDYLRDMERELGEKREFVHEL